MTESPHNVSTLKELMDERDIRYEQRFVAQEKAIGSAEGNAEKWRQNANEWRAAMTDREREFLPRNIGYIFAAVACLAAIVAIAGRFF